MINIIGLSEKVFSVINNTIEDVQKYIRSFRGGITWSIDFENKVFSCGMQKTIKESIKKYDLTKDEQEIVFKYLKEYYACSLSQ